MFADGDLFEVANSLARLVGAPVTIEDPDTIVVAYSGGDQDVDVVLAGPAQTGVILTHGNRARNLHRRLRVAATLNQLGQIFPDMPALPEEHGHDGNRIAAVGNEFADRGG